MAKGLREIKRRLKSVRNMRQITKAMEMVAAANLRRAQVRAESARPYAEKMREVIATIAAGAKEEVQHPMLQSRPIKRTGYLIITSDRGLAGGYNANLLREAIEVIHERHKSPDEYAILVIGRKGRDFLRRRGIEIDGEITGLPDSPRFSDIKSIAARAVQKFADGEIDELYIWYNKFITALTQRPTESRLLPLADVGEHSEISYEYEPSPEAVLEVLLPKYAETLIFAALLEAKASEFGARMNAMGNATRNANDMIHTLTLEYNRARQAAITQEITEIVAGANASQGY
ncbi:ATP synthase gamma chain [Insulibacter thermoxylanivorax]|uniref:ATP synthase gamma chain n=1 Tax=Insulibacter thermoxylanivorax TaxID=2749268 RepID=A0A916QEN7_9BACL|nr:ATP synthase F1 subunit gamma [Insulibacter thermoxylanivorax]GFR39386.1 ATP synthase gamma chain [Insulibacter thermoxylanivorax]